VLDVVSSRHASSLHNIAEEIMEEIMAFNPYVFKSGLTASDFNFQQFVPLTAAGVVEMVGALADKQCSTKPMPTWLFGKYPVDFLTVFF